MAAHNELSCESKVRSKDNSKHLGSDGGTLLLFLTRSNGKLQGVVLAALKRLLSHSGD